MNIKFGKLGAYYEVEQRPKWFKKHHVAVFALGSLYPIAYASMEDYNAYSCKKLWLFWMLLNVQNHDEYKNQLRLRKLGL